MRDLTGEVLVDGWQPDDLRAVIAREETALADVGWQDAFQFHRVSSPAP